MNSQPEQPDDLVRVHVYYVDIVDGAYWGRVAWHEETVIRVYPGESFPLRPDETVERPAIRYGRIRMRSEHIGADLSKLITVSRNEIVPRTEVID